MTPLYHTHTTAGSRRRAPLEYAQPRPRSISTMTMFPYADDDYVTPSDLCRPSIPVLLPPFPDLSSTKQSTEIPSDESIPTLENSLPLRAISPFPSHPYVIDSCSLQAAVSRDPSRIFDAIQKLVNERDAYKAEVNRANSELDSVTEDLKNVRLDYKAAREKYEELFRIAGAKQVILWKFVERLQQSNPNTQVPMRPTLSIDPRGNGVMGVAMEKWISEGMEGEKAFKPADEASDQGTENSFWSAEESVGGRNLDPHAQAFIPGSSSPTKDHTKYRRRSPGKQNRSPPKFRLDGSPTKFSEASSNQYSPTPTKRSSLAVQEQAHGQQKSMMHLLPTPRPVTESELISMLPSRWYRICPFTLLDHPPCPLGATCHLRHLCNAYNDPSGPGCPEDNDSCPFVHKFRCCFVVVDGKQGGCVWEANGLGKHSAAKEQTKAKRNGHMKFRAHKSSTHMAEWDYRMLVLALRDAHANGLYN